MAPNSYRRHRFPPVVIQHAGLYLRFTLSYRDIEDLLGEARRTWSEGSGPLTAFLDC